MSVADYGPSSQTLTFLDPEDDLGSLGIGADTQVGVTCAKVFLYLSLCLLSVLFKYLQLRAMVTTFTTPCQASRSIWRNLSGEDHNDWQCNPMSI